MAKANNFAQFNILLIFFYLYPPALDFYFINVLTLPWKVADGVNLRRLSRRGLDEN